MYVSLSGFIVNHRHDELISSVEIVSFNFQAFCTAQ